MKYLRHIKACNYPCFPLNIFLFLQFQTGADIVGVNCSFGPSVALETMRMMKEALDEEGLSPFLMAQPAGWHTTEVRNDVMGYISLPEFPFGKKYPIMGLMSSQCHKHLIE